MTEEGEESGRGILRKDEAMSQPSGCLGLLLKLLGIAPKGAVGQAYPFGVRDDFLSPAELSFYQVLRSLLPPDVAVAVKVG